MSTCMNNYIIILYWWVTYTEGVRYTAKLLWQRRMWTALVADIGKAYWRLFSLDSKRLHPIQNIRNAQMFVQCTALFDEYLIILYADWHFSYLWWVVYNKFTLS